MAQRWLGVRHMRWCWLILLAVLGCAGTETGDVCEAAADHVAVCTGQAPAARTASCDVAQAEAVLAMSCDELAASAAKADGIWDGVLCALGFASYCPADQPRALSGAIQKLGTTDRIDFVVHVRAIREDSSGERHAVVAVNGYFYMSGLAPARYRLEVALAPTSTALATKSVDAAVTSTVFFHIPVP